MNASRKNIMIGTAGHVDHGKTALVKLLTGCDTDSLQEEKQRGLTIDLGFAPCQLSDQRVVGIVDVPGHLDFIRNMVAGAHGIDVAMLVVAADDGIMPQTHEHLHILTLMGLCHGLVALTKVDLVDAARRAEVTAELRRLLADTFLRDAPICPVSTITGEGFDGFYDTLNAVVAGCEPRSSAGLFRMWVEDVFTIRGSGTVITGIPSSGRVRCGDKVGLAPGAVEARVRRIQVYGKEDTEGRAGECVALNISELDHNNVRRGMVLGDPDALALSATVEAGLRLLPALKGALKDYAEAQFHIGTAAMPANVALLESSEMAPGSSQMVQIRLQGALPVAPGERFVLRGAFGPGGATTTLGGGRVLSACNIRLRRRRADTIQSLADRSAALGKPGPWLELLLKQSSSPISPNNARKSCQLRLEEFEVLLAELVASGRICRTASGNLVHADTLGTAAESIARVVREAVQKDPRRAGVTSEELASALPMDAELLRQGCEAAVSRKLIDFRAPVFAPSGWHPQVSEKESHKYDQLAEKFRSGGWNPPSAIEAAAQLCIPEPEVRQAMRLLQERGVLIRLDDKISMHKEAVDQAKAKVLELFRRRPLFTTMEFRDALGVSRKFAVPLLDYLDRVRFTVRTGHDRTPGAEIKRLL